MTQYLIPTSDALVEQIAKAFAKERLILETHRILSEAANKEMPKFAVETVIDQSFEGVWQGSTPADEHYKEMLRADARIAIRTINLNLMMLPE